MTKKRPGGIYDNNETNNGHKMGTLMSTHSFKWCCVIVRRHFWWICGKRSAILHLYLQRVLRHSALLRSPLSREWNETCCFVFFKCVYILYIWNLSAASQKTCLFLGKKMVKGLCWKTQRLSDRLIPTVANEKAANEDVSEARNDDDDAEAGRRLEWIQSQHIVLEEIHILHDWCMTGELPAEKERKAHCANWATSN